MIDVANGYFETLQLNDGKLHTEFTPDCDRREDGMQSTNNAQVGLNAANSGLGCSAQFELGWYRYDDRLRDRRFLGGGRRARHRAGRGFHRPRGPAGEYTLTNGTKRTSNYRRPHTYVLFEAFRIEAGKIQQVEAAVHHRALQHALAVGEAADQFALSSPACFRRHLHKFGGWSLSKANRSVVLYSLIPAFLVVSVLAVHGCPGRLGASAAKPTNWSDPATWPNRKVPAAGDKVEIASGKEVILDVSPPAAQRPDHQRQAHLC